MLNIYLISDFPNFYLIESKIVSQTAKNATDESITGSSGVNSLDSDTLNSTVKFLSKIKYVPVSNENFR